MPPPTAQDFQHQQQPDLTSETYLRATQEAVEANFRRVGLMDDKVKFLKGWFKDTLHAAPVRQLALLRMDGDLYSSTMDILRALYEKVSPGGFVIADDYYAWTACKQAVTDYRQEHQITAPIQQIDWTGVFWQLPASDR
jgi:O-methyltransferase